MDPSKQEFVLTQPIVDTLLKRCQEKSGGTLTARAGGDIAESEELSKLILYRWRTKLTETDSLRDSEILLNAIARKTR
ncbi:MAG: hypothetical protein M1305_07190 [Candidatus Marsarchaeota archaeon]|nr:hypothetical protein [Candidatus Marsarchaeota archaeon]